MKDNISRYSQEMSFIAWMKDKTSMILQENVFHRLDEGQNKHVFSGKCLSSPG
ncbi:hypothetical protein KHA87_03520 [Bacillus sp. FJAT-49736]|nr:hypothetical protein [Bacillus sp. FJAT-49736]